MSLEAQRGIAGFWMGLASLLISLGLAVLRVWEFTNARVRLNVVVGTTRCTTPPEWEGADECYQLQVTNKGTRATSINLLRVRPYVRRPPWGRHVGSGEDFISDELGLNFVRLGPGETKQWEIPFHRLYWNLTYDAGDEQGSTRVNANHQLCEIHHTESSRPKVVLLD